jgi:hypothetical protein
LDQPSRKLRVVVWLLAGCAGVLLAGGCQSASQSDLIARERRLQEDKIYALQDYLADYQQLLCQYRAENAALRDQLGISAEAGGAGLDPPSARSRNGPPARPPRPRQGNEPGPLPDFEVPRLDVPRIEAQSSLDEESAAAPANEQAIALVSHDQAAPAAGPPLRVWLSGEVVANESGGPRILVDVAALSDAGRAMAFAGPVSLMVLAPQGTGPPQNLARWDFSPEDARAAAEESPDPYAMRFRLELPADAAISQPAELWVRLLHEGGGKLLAKVPLDLARPHSFASAPFDTATPLATVDSPAPFLLDSDMSERPLILSLLAAQDGWTIARPGESIPLPSGPSKPANAWRAASEPLPIVVAASPAARPSPPSRQSDVAAADGKSVISTSEGVRPTPPSWSPERLTGESTVSAKPARRDVESLPSLFGWSPTR